MSALQGRHVVLGVTGGIAAYKSADLTSRLRKQGCEVRVIMTHNATEFVQPITFETLSGAPVTVDTFHREAPWQVEHVALAQWADLFVVAPATANILAKMASGIADDMLSTTLLAARCPVLVAPAMNTAMWQHAATQTNMATLRSRGVHVIGPGSGLLACGDTGSGRMSEPAEIVEAMCVILGQKKDLEGLRVMVTAGGTRERLDPVRYIGNDSTGRMGFAIAEAARDRGAEVTVVCGTVSVPVPAGMKILPVESTLDLYEAVTGAASEMDIIIQAAAPADYRPLHPSRQKIKKQDGANLVVELTENPDVAAAVGKMKRPGQTLVGFAAETEHLTENAVRKLDKKNLDMIVANDVTMPGAGFGTDTNIAALITREGIVECPLQSKRELAGRILDRILEIRGK